MGSLDPVSVAVIGGLVDPVFEYSITAVGRIKSPVPVQIIPVA